MEGLQPKRIDDSTGPARPACSEVCFTTATGMGCGLLVLLGVFASGETVPADRWFGLAALGVALAALALGLVSSNPLAGHPEGAQLPSRWPARARLLATGSGAAAALFAVGWVGYGEVDGFWRAPGLAAAALAGFAVHASAMVYATRQTVPAWCNPWVVPLQLALALLTGALWLNALLAPFGRASPDAALIVVVTLFLSFYLKRRYWRFIDTVRAAHAQQGTGEGIARERAVKLRRYAFVLLFALPLVLTMAAMEADPWLAPLAAAAAAISGSAGVVIERWLFLAEAS